ncbi:MAG: heavy metal translocating P-type ATPase [Fimbriimonadales bacterium]|nr:heavy metal translocating P-type ATPase [Fimbriimonadales bacterium]MDW8052528.1 heavy metal translocating P-type ATPase [Armatimonadota bacterium]
MGIVRTIRRRLAEAASCADAMAKVALAHKGIWRIRYRYRQNLVEVEYDPQLLSEEEARRIAEPLLYELGIRIPTCSMRDSEAGVCAACPSIQQKGRRWQLDGVVYRAHFDGETLCIEQEGAPSEPTDRFLRRVKALERPEPLWKTRALWEPVLSALTLLMLVVGGVLRWQGLPGWANLAYAVAYFTGGYFGVIDGYHTLRERRIDVNFLMIAAAIGAAVVGEAPEGATLLFLFSLSNTLQAYALARSRRAVRALMALQPDTALRLTPTGTETVPVDELQVGDRILVRAGDRIPADGVVLSGESHVDQSPITGESIPVHKAPGAFVYAGTINGTGTLEVEVRAPATETLLHRIMQLVEQAQEQKARTQRWLERFEQRYALAVIGGAALVALGLPLLGWQFTDAFYRAMTLLVVASPCALVISTPATLLSAIANAAKRGILFKGGEPVERLATVRAIALDKTGTLTEGKLQFTELVVLNDATEAEVWQAIIDIESRSEHPLAQALVQAAAARGYTAHPVERVEALPGKGICATRVDGTEIRIGNLRLFEGMEIPTGVVEAVERLHAAGNTAMVVWVGGRFLGVAAAADTVRPQAAQAVAQLHALGIPCVAMLTGDAEQIARAVAHQTGIDRVYADLLPDEKLATLRQLSQEFGAVAMVGDGVNDAPALAAAEVGIAMGAGTDVALETADIALVGNDLNNLPYAVALSRHAMRILKQNLIFATGVILVLVVLTFTANLRLPLGVIGHEGSTLLVVLNGLRLLWFRFKA